MKNYNSYHTSIKQLARHNKLPNKYASCIDRSTIWRWKQENDDKYLGHELSNIQALQQFLERRESETLIRTYLKTALAFSAIFNKTNQFKSILSQNKDIFVKILVRYQNVIKITYILRALNLPPSVFYLWKNQVLYPCRSSPMKLCRRIYPNQLTYNETTKLKSMLTSQAFKYWPTSSIAHYARRNNILHISLSTWYSYIQKLGIKRPAQLKKPRYKIGIRANLPHQIWHADITIVKCLNGMKYYVYLLMDNYSRFVLDFRVSEKVSASVRLDSIRHSYKEYIKDPLSDIRLLVDGGVENNNHLVDQYLRSEKIFLRKLIAGKDIRFSNSIVEAQNRLIKYHYLFRHPFRHIQHLRTLLDWIIKDYNHTRPHHPLGGLTPHEALIGHNPPTELWKMQKQKAKQIRLDENTAKSCGIC